MDEKRIIDFCRDLAVISNKYKLSLSNGKEGIIINNIENDVGYAAIIPRSATDFPYTRLAVVNIIT